MTMAMIYSYDSKKTGKFLAKNDRKKLEIW